MLSRHARIVAAASTDATTTENRTGSEEDVKKIRGS